MEVIVDEINKEDGTPLHRSVFIEKDDICMFCEQQYGCPLIECLANGLVEATEPIKVSECTHFKMFNGQ